MRGDEEVISKDSWRDTTFNHFEDPWSHDDGNHGHAEGAPLGNRASVSPRNTKVFTKLITTLHVVNVSEVWFEYLFGHSSCLSKFKKKLSINLVKAFVDIDGGTSSLHAFE